jgi:hypothetical protein
MPFKNVSIKLLGMLAYLTVEGAAADSDYRCTIERVIMDSSTEATTLKWEEKTYIGKQFTVERNSGLMAGILKNSYTTKPVVIDIGSKDNSYKVITTMRLEEGAGASSHFYALNIKEFAESEQKPFVFLWNDTVYMGRCVHF